MEWIKMWYFKNNSVKPIESDCKWSNNVCTHSVGRGIFENDSIEYDYRDKYNVNETSDWLIERNDLTRIDYLKW